jgi:hypothetical protein
VTRHPWVMFGAAIVIGAAAIWAWVEILVAVFTR